MAVTKTHPIKSTLKAAIDYILNPEKTDGKLLASSFGCGLETADIEFAWTREAAGDRGTHLGRHLIQSFAVGETTPEEAHKIGMELAGAVLGGKYEFVLTTHVDKDHLHNHLIFNSVSFVDYKKYHSNKQSYYHIRRTSDRICKEHGLSVVVPGQDRGKSYAEYTAEKQGTPNAKTCAKRDNQSLQYTNCAVEKLHINLAFCRCAAQKKLLKMKMPPLFLGGCVLVGQIYFVYVKGFIGLYDCRTGRHIPFHVKSVSFPLYQKGQDAHRKK